MPAGTVGVQERAVSVVVEVDDLPDRAPGRRSVPSPQGPSEGDDRTGRDVGGQRQGAPGLGPGPEGERGEGGAEPDGPGRKEQVLHGGEDRAVEGGPAHAERARTAMETGHDD